MSPAVSLDEMSDRAPDPVPLREGAAAVSRRARSPTPCTISSQRAKCRLVDHDSQPRLHPLAIGGRARAATAGTRPRGAPTREPGVRSCRGAGARRAPSAVSLRALALLDGGRDWRSAAAGSVGAARRFAGSARACAHPGRSGRAAPARQPTQRSAATCSARGSSSPSAAAPPRLSSARTSELAATGAHPRTILRSGLDELTASERRVAQMAAEELSNKEIAQALFVTVKTVEQHLGRVYRKLDISSRRQLGAALGGPAEAPTPA